MTTLIETIQTGLIPGQVTLGVIGIMFLDIYLSRIPSSLGPEGSSGRGSVTRMATK